MSDNFYVPPANIIEKKIFIRSPGEVRHIGKVLRYQPGDNLDIFNGLGKRCKAVITVVGKDRIEGEIIEEYAENNEARVAVTLGCALLKQEKFDWLIEKATELGVRTIIPLVTERTIVHPHHDRTFHKTERWRKLALAACQQSQRSYLPEIKEPLAWPHLFAQKQQHDLVLVAALEEKQNFISDLLADHRQLQTVMVLIGPEGGLSRNELLLAQKNGACPVSLGKRRLRAETAAIVALTLILARLNG